MKKFLIKLLIAMAILTLAGWILFSFFVPQHYLPVLPWMLLFFGALTYGIFYFHVRLISRDMMKFTAYSMVITFFRLFVYIAFTVVYLILSSENIAVFVIAIAVVYMVYTILEASEVSTLLKKSDQT